MSKSSAITASLVVAVLAAMIVFQTFYEIEESNKERQAPITEIPLVGADGKAISLADFADRSLLLFFGYRSCPDVCPMTLSYLRREWAELGPASKDWQVVFVSVDPKRDSPELLEQYVDSFDEDFMGLSGEQADLERLARRLGAFFSYEDTTSEMSYLVNHSGSLFLIGPDGKLLRAITPPHEKGMVVQAIHDVSAKGML